MDTKPYETDSPYTNLTFKNCESCVFQKNRRRRKDRLQSLCSVVFVAVCVLFGVATVIYIVNDAKLEKRIAVAEARITGLTADLATLQTQAKALKQTGEPTPAIIDEDELYENGGDESEEFEDEEDDELSADDDVGGDSEEEEEGEEEYGEEEEEEKSRVMSDKSEPVESGLGYDDSDYFSDDIDEALEGSGLEEYERVRRSAEAETATKKPSKAKRTKGKGKGKRQRVKKPKMGKLKFLPAAQFDGSVSSGTIEKYCKKFSTFDAPKCSHVAEMEGILCNNQTFIPDEKSHPLRIFSPEPWVNPNTSPVDIDNSVLTVKSSGVHLVYAQVMFSGYEARKSAFIVVTSGTDKEPAYRRLSCNADMSSYSLDQPDVYEKNLVTCTIVGVMHLTTGNKLELQTGNQYAAIERVQGATYLGIVQLNKDK